MKNSIIAAVIGGVIVLTAAVGSNAFAGGAETGEEIGVANVGEFYVDTDNRSVPANTVSSSTHRCDDGSDRIVSAGLTGLDAGSSVLSDGPVAFDAAADGVGWREAIRADSNGDSFELRMVCEDLDGDN